MKKGVLRNFARFTGKHLRQSLLFNKVAGLSPFLQNTSGRLLLKHLPKNIRKDVSLFLTHHHCSMETDIIGKRVKYGGGYGLEIPV